MKFKTAVAETSEIEVAYVDGLRALRQVDRRHVTAQNTKRLAGSVDVDSTLKSKYPRESRWDYAIAHRPKNLVDEMVYWVEIHPASDGEINVVLSKLQWLKDWLKAKAPKLNSIRKEFIWISSGKTSFTLASPQQKRFASLGLQHKGRVFNIPDYAAD